MQADKTALPYSKKALKALVESLKIHGSLVWMDPVTNALSIKQVPKREGVQRQEFSLSMT